MSDACTLAVRKQARAKGSARLVLLIYAFYADGGGENAYPSPQTIAEETGLKLRRVYGIIDELEADGELLYTGRSPIGTRAFRVQPGAQPITPVQPVAQNMTPAVQPAAQPNAPGVQPVAQATDSALQPAAQSSDELQRSAQFTHELVQPGAQPPPKLQPAAPYSESNDDSFSNPPGENQSVNQTRGRAREDQASKSLAPPQVGARTLSEFDYWRMTFKAEGFNEPGLTELARAASDQHVSTAQMDAYLDAIFANKLLHDPHGYIVRNGARDGFKVKTNPRKPASAKPQTVEDEIAEARRRYGGYSQFNGLMTFGADEIPSVPDDDKSRPQPPQRR